MSDEREQVNTANAAPVISDLLGEIAEARIQVARHGSLGMPGQLLGVLVLAEERIIKADRAQKQLQDSLLRQAARIRELRAELEAERRAMEEELGRCRKELNEWRSGLRCRAHSDEIRGISGTAAIEGFTGEGEFRHLTIRNGIITEAR